MHGYIIASIFAFVFLLAVITVIILTCCFRRRCHYNNGGGSLPWDKGSAHQQMTLESRRMLPDGDSTYSPSRTGLGPMSTISGGYIPNPGYLLTPGAHHRQSMISPVPVMMDETGQLITLKRPCSMIGGDGVPLVLLGPNGAPSPSSSMMGGGQQQHPQLVRYLPASAASVRRFSRLHEDEVGVGYSVDQGSISYMGGHMTPHLSLAGSQTLNPGSSAMLRPGSSNTVASDKISLGSGSDRFSVQSDSKRVKPPQSHPASYCMYPVQSSCGPTLMPQTASMARRQHMMLPQQAHLVTLAPSPDMLHHSQQLQQQQQQQQQFLYCPYPKAQQMQYHQVDVQERANISGQSMSNISSSNYH